MARSRYYKGAQATLQGPHFNNPTGGAYLPGSEHSSPLEVSSPYGKGIHFTSHPRVASRWAPVVLEVEVLGETFLIPEQVAPRYRNDIPDSLAMGKYNKYRTDRLRVLRIIGVATYSWMGRSGSLAEASRVTRDLNLTLRRAGLLEVERTGRSLQRLRDDGFVLWGIDDPNAQPASKAPTRRIEKVDLTYKGRTEKVLLSELPVSVIERLTRR